MTPLRPRAAPTARLSLFFVGVLVLAGCGLGNASTTPAVTTVASPSLGPAPSVGPTASGPISPGPSDSIGPSPTTSSPPSVGPTQSGPPAPSPSPSGAASVCSGAKDTPDFYAAFAGSVSYPVYCAVLPAGWSLVSGTYHLASGGRITINFRRRTDGATFELDQGSFCADNSGCVPSGTAAGSGPYGDLDGTVIQTSTGFALVVAKGEKPSWLAVGNGLDQGAFLALTGALHAVK